MSREQTVTAVAAGPLNAKGFGPGLSISGAVRNDQPVTYGVHRESRAGGRHPKCVHTDGKECEVHDLVVHRFVRRPDRRRRRMRRPRPCRIRQRRQLPAGDHRRRTVRHHLAGHAGRRPPEPEPDGLECPTREHSHAALPRLYRHAWADVDLHPRRNPQSSRRVPMVRGRCQRGTQTTALPPMPGLFTVLEMSNPQAPTSRFQAAKPPSTFQLIPVMKPASGRAK